MVSKKHIPYLIQSNLARGITTRRKTNPEVLPHFKRKIGLQFS